MANEFYALLGRMRNITRWGLMRNPKANIAVVPSDHMVTDEKKFAEAITQSLEYAARHNYEVVVRVHIRGKKIYCSETISPST